MTIIHIWESYSNQTTEVQAETVEKGLWAYAHNACWSWNELVKATNYNDSKWVFEFDYEVLTLTAWDCRNDRAWVAEWMAKYEVDGEMTWEEY